MMASLRPLGVVLLVALVLVALVLVVLVVIAGAGSGATVAAGLAERELALSPRRSGKEGRVLALHQV